MDGLLQGRAVVRCMRYLQAAELNEAERREVEEALNPPLSIAVGAGTAYGASFIGLRRWSPQLRARGLLLQLAACIPAGLVLGVCGLQRSHWLLQNLLRRDAPGGVGLSADLRSRCPEILPH
mmetsp:Transcript_27458/g.60087  ORF Transcript_27458/g.60087 Transcript_27458/m.60087 type:complete len:122 (+) Transcript_27458:67-432(+)